MQKAHYCTFVTIGDDGQPQARIGDPKTWLPLAIDFPSKTQR